MKTKTPKVKKSQILRAIREVSSRINGLRREIGALQNMQEEQTDSQEEQSDSIKQEIELLRASLGGITLDVMNFYQQNNIGVVYEQHGKQYVIVGKLKNGLSLAVECEHTLLISEGEINRIIISKGGVPKTPKMNIAK